MHRGTQISRLYVDRIKTNSSTLKTLSEYDTHLNYNKLKSYETKLVSTTGTSSSIDSTVKINIESEKKLLDIIKYNKTNRNLTKYEILKLLEKDGITTEDLVFPKKTETYNEDSEVDEIIFGNHETNSLHPEREETETDLTGIQNSQQFDDIYEATP